MLVTVCCICSKTCRTTCLVWLRLRKMAVRGKQLFKKSMLNHPNQFSTHLIWFLSTNILLEQAPARRHQTVHAECRPNLNHHFLSGRLDASLQLQPLKQQEGLCCLSHNTVHMLVRTLRPPQSGRMRFPCRGEWWVGTEVKKWVGCVCVWVKGVGGLSCTEVVEINLQSGSQCHARGIQTHPTTSPLSTLCGTVVSSTHPHTKDKCVCRVFYHVYFTVLLGADTSCHCKTFHILSD